MNPSLSDAERRVYDAIMRLEATLARRPSQQEIARAAGYKSKGSANKYIKRLEEKGWLKRDYEGLSTLRLAAA
jgi:SOS-response transcriptional repressor LexA